MKKIFAYIFIALLPFSSACDLMNTDNGVGISDAEGLKEALRIGTDSAVTNLNVTDGYLGNALVKILLPPEAQQIQEYAAQAGIGEQLFEDALVSINRAAEKAAKDAKPIFVNAITSMTIQDASNILFSSNDKAATDYLQGKTYTSLQSLYQPKVQASLQSVGATAIWGNIVNPYNQFANTLIGQFAGAKPVNPNLEEYVTKKALDGLFIMVAKEEKNIRENPLARVTDILKTIFGKLDK